MQKSTVVSEPSSQLPELVGIPLSMDMALHAAPALSLLLDFYAFEKAFDGVLDAVKVMLPFTVWYVLWVEYCGAQNGFCEFNTVVLKCKAN